MWYKRLIRDRSGSAMLQFAIILPAFLMLLLGTIEIGRYFFMQHSIKTLASETARQAVIRTALNSGGCTLTNADITTIKSTALLKTPFLNAASATTFTVSCSLDSDKRYVIAVSIAYPYATLVPYVSFLSGSLTDTTQLTYSPIRG